MFNIQLTSSEPRKKKIYCEINKSGKRNQVIALYITSREKGKLGMKREIKREGGGRKGRENTSSG